MARSVGSCRIDSNHVAQQGALTYFGPEYDEKLTITKKERLKPVGATTSMYIPKLTIGEYPYYRYIGIYYSTQLCSLGGLLVSVVIISLGKSVFCGVLPHDRRDLTTTSSEV